MKQTTTCGDCGHTFVMKKTRKGYEVFFEENFRPPIKDEADAQAVYEDMIANHWCWTDDDGSRVETRVVWALKVANGDELSSAYWSELPRNLLTDGDKLEEYMRHFAPPFEDDYDCYFDSLRMDITGLPDGEELAFVFAYWKASELEPTSEGSKAEELALLQSLTTKTKVLVR